MVQEKQQTARNHLLTVLFTGLAKSELPVITAFKAPREADKFIEFYAAYQASEWDYKAAIAPYKREQLINFNLHFDRATGEYTYTVPQHKGYRGLSIVPCDDEE